MKGAFVGFLLMCFMPSVVLAGVRNSDNRYYVSDEMWKQEPYKKFVYFEVMATDGEELVPSGHCSAQYVSPNLILSAGHCTDKDADAAAAWDAQKEESAQKVKTGATVGGVGAAGGAVGNAIINGKSEKNKNLIK